MMADEAGGGATHRVSVGIVREAAPPKHEHRDVDGMQGKGDGSSTCQTSTTKQQPSQDAISSNQESQQEGEKSTASEQSPVKLEKKRATLAMLASVADAEQKRDNDEAIQRANENCKMKNEPRRAEGDATQTAESMNCQDMQQSQLKIAEKGSHLPDAKAGNGQASDTKKEDNRKREQERINSEMVKTAKAFSNDPLVQLSFLRAMQQQKLDPEQVKKNKIEVQEQSQAKANSQARVRAAKSQTRLKASAQDRTLASGPKNTTKVMKNATEQNHNSNGRVMMPSTPQAPPAQSTLFGDRKQPNYPALQQTQPSQIRQPHGLINQLAQLLGGQQTSLDTSLRSQTSQPSVSQEPVQAVQAQLLQLLQAFGASQGTSQPQAPKPQPKAPEPITAGVHASSPMNPLALLLLQSALTNIQNPQNRQQQVQPTQPQQQVQPTQPNETAKSAPTPATNNNDVVNLLRQLGVRTLASSGQTAVAGSAPNISATEFGKSFERVSENVNESAMSNLSDSPSSGASMEGKQENERGITNDSHQVITIPCRARGMPADHNFKVRT